MKHSIPVFLLAALLLILALEAPAQQLGELTVTPVPEGEGIMYLVRKPSDAVLIVQSTLPQLFFEGSQGIIKVDNPDPGEFRVFVPPGSNIITIKAPDFKPIKQRFHIEAKTCQEIRVTPKYTPISADRPQLTLRYNPLSAAERVMGAVDGNILHLDFHSGEEILRLAAGTHRIKLNNGGRVWEKSFQLSEGDRVVEEVIFPSIPTDTTQVFEFGRLFITSDPPGSIVYLNELEQGRTPLTLENVQPGRYQIDVTRPLFLTSHSVIDVAPRVYTPHHVALTPNFGRLIIESHPSGAEVFLDEKSMGLTPLTLSQTPAGSHGLRLKKTYYYEITAEAGITAGDSITRTFELKPRFGSLLVISEPDSAEVAVDGVARGITPLSLDTLESGRHALSVNLEHYHEAVDDIRLEDGENRTCRYDLTGDFGTLTIVSNPPGARVEIEGLESRPLTTPVRDFKIDPGSYMVEVTRDDHESFETVVTVARGDHQILEPDLLRKSGHLKISSNPELADIYLDGKLVGRTPTVLQNQPTGSYTLRLDRKGFDVIETPVEVGYRQIVNLHYDLSAEGTKEWLVRRNQARLMSLALPGTGQMVSGDYWRGGLYSAAFVLTFLTMVGISADHQTESDHYDEALQAYQSTEEAEHLRLHHAEMNGAHDQMQDLDNRYKLAAATLGAIYLWQVTDAWLWGGGPRPVAVKSRVEMGGWEAAPYAQADGNSFRAGVVLTGGNRR